MNSSSERLVVFVTPAQKRVLAARAARLGISLSELVRRAVLAFDDTGEEVRAAGLVDRLGAARSRAVDGDPVRRLASGQAVPNQAAVSGQAKRAPKSGLRQAPSAGGPPLPSTADGASLLGRAVQARPSAGADDENRTALPVAAAVAQALALQAEAQAQAGARSDPDDEASVARLIAHESRDLSRF
ncbi:MAG TPA: hypothetical protein VF446_15645 [Trinickia sp.]